MVLGESGSDGLNGVFRTRPQGGGVPQARDSVPVPVVRPDTTSPSVDAAGSGFHAVRAMQLPHRSVKCLFLKQVGSESCF